MKYFALLLCALLFTSVANSQSLKLTSFTKNFVDTVDGSWKDFHMGVENISSSIVPTRVRVDKSQLLPGHRVKFCFATQCYDESTVVSEKGGGTSRIAAGGFDTSTFVGDFRSDSTLGKSTISFTFFNDNNQLDAVVAILVRDVKVDALTAAVTDNDVSSTFSATPIPASDEVLLRLPNPTQSMRSLRIIDVQGRELNTLDFNADQLSFNTSALPNGCYAALVRSVDGSYAQIRFVIAH